MTGSCDAKRRNAECHFSDVRGNVFFNILLVSSCSAKKSLHGLQGSPAQVWHGPWGEHASGTRSSPWKEPQVSLSIHCMDSKVENIHGVCALRPLRVIACRTAAVPCRDCLSLVECCVSLSVSSVTFMPHTQACPAGNLRLGVD